jgi:hypothetical protein
MAKLDLKNNDEHQFNRITCGPPQVKKEDERLLSPHDSNLPRLLELKAAPFGFKPATNNKETVVQICPSADYHLTLLLSGPTPLCGSTHGKTAAVNLCDWH